MSVATSRTASFTQMKDGTRERWDQSCFAPEYRSDPLASFEPAVRAVFSRKAYDAAHVRPGEATGLPRLAAG